MKLVTSDHMIVINIGICGDCIIFTVRDRGYVLWSSPILGRSGRLVLPDSQWLSSLDQLMSSIVKML